MMNSVETDKYILRLLELQANYNWRVEQISHVGIEFDDPIIGENLLNLALDMIGVPADNSDEYPELNEPNDPRLEGWFCRDWYGDEFDRVVPDGTSLQCLAYVKIVRARVDSWNSKEEKGGKK